MVDGIVENEMITTNAPLRCARRGVDAVLKIGFHNRPGSTYVQLSV